MKEENRFTHRQLEEVGAKWLSKSGYWWSCKRIAIEPTSPGSEHPDVIGFAYGVTHVIECKTTRDDLEGCGDGLLWRTADGDIQFIKDPSRRAEEERNMIGELCILYSMLSKEAASGNRATFY